jgi:hypothetical protein
VNGSGSMDLVFKRIVAQIAKISLCLKGVNDQTRKGLVKPD